jgi:hypothetical protein
MSTHPSHSHLSPAIPATASHTPPRPPLQLFPPTLPNGPPAARLTNRRQIPADVAADVAGVGMIRVGMKKNEKNGFVFRFFCLGEVGYERDSVGSGGAGGSGWSREPDVKPKSFTNQVR